MIKFAKKNTSVIIPTKEETNAGYDLYANKEIKILEYTFILTEQEANIILAGLVKLPYGEVVNVIQKIQTQASEQQNPKEVNIEDEKSKSK